MPPELTAVLAALAVQASPGDFAAAERLLGGSFSGLANIRRNPVATIDAAELTRQEVSDQLSGLPIGHDAELHVAWIAERFGARMSFATFAANAGDLWFPAMDDIASFSITKNSSRCPDWEHHRRRGTPGMPGTRAVSGMAGRVPWMPGSSPCSPWFATGRACAMPGSSIC